MDITVENMEEERCLKPGDKAPVFTLNDQNGKKFTLSRFKGKRVLLSFHPLAWTSVCAKQMKSLELNKNIFDELNTLAVGLSIDSSPSKHAWAETLDIHHTRLLSDFWPHGEIAKLYGVFREEDGVSERANIILNMDHKVEYIQIYELSQLPDIDEIITILKTLEED